MTKETKLKVRGPKPLGVLMVEDSEDDVLLTIREIRKGGFDPVYERVETAATMKKALREKQWDIILCDYKMPKFDAPSAIAVLKDTNIDIPIIIVSGTIGEDVAAECMRLGAQDYIMKGNLSRLCPAITRELEDAEVRIQRKLADDKLLNAAKEWQITFDATYDAIWILDQDQRVLRSNKAAERFFHRPLGQMIGKHCWEIVHGTEQPIPECPILLVRKSLRRETTEIQDHGHWFEIHVDPILDAAGRYSGAVHIVSDITERKQAEEALRQSEKRYRTILETIQEGYFEVDFAGNFTFFNDSLCQFLGYTREELMGMNNRQYTDIEHAEKLFQTFNKVYNTGEPSEGFDWQVIRRDGTKRYVEASISLQKDSSGKPIGFRGIARDVTERKRAEEALRVSEQLFRNYLEYAPDGVYMNELNGTFLYGNHKCEEIIGYKREELIGKNFLEINLLPEKSRKKAIELLQLNIEGKPTGPDEIELISKEGRIIPVEINTSVVQSDGEGIVLAFVRDITERKQADDALKKSELNYRQLFDNAPSAIYQVDFRTGKFLKANDVICEYFGCSHEEITSLSPYDLLTEESRKLFFDRLNKMIIGDKVPEEPEYEFIDKNGKRRWLKLNSKNIYDSEGLAGADVVAHEITERKLAEEELSKSEERYRIIADNTADTIAIFDLNLNPTYISPSILKLRGYTVQEAMTLTLDQTLTPDSLQQASKMLTDEMALDSSGTADPARTAMLDLEENCKDGSTIWVELVASFLRDNNFKPTGILTVTRNITERKQAEAELRQTLESLRRAVAATIQVMVSAVELRDPYTAGHQLRVADLARAIATEMGLPQDKIEGIRMAGTIHDIGKLSIPAEILSKPTKLTNNEFNLIKEHSQTGYDMLKDVDSPWPLAQIVYQHHERMNGSGYPRNLKGDEILMEARIMAVADVVEAMASHRPYRPSLGIDVALAEIEKNKGTFYDDAVADTCLKLFREKGYKLD